MIEKLRSFIDESPTAFHVVETAKDILRQHGFEDLMLDSESPLSEGKYLKVWGDSTLVALVVPPSLRRPRFLIAGAHTDSPHLRLRSRASFKQQGYSQWSVEPYGGVLLHTWFDRDLSLAGRVFVREKDQPSSRLIHFTDPLCVIPSLAIHLNRGVNRDGFRIDSETHLHPVFARSEGPDLEQILANKLGFSPRDILAYDLSLYNVQGGGISGANGEFFHSARIDNLAMCHAAMEALSHSTEINNNAVLLMTLFDNEEVGSRTPVGALSDFFPTLLKEVFLKLGGKIGDYLSVIERSVFASIDMAHGLHPNYVGSHTSNHRPMLGGGPVIKINENQSYSTTGKTQALMVHLAKQNNIPYQIYHHRNDIPCGSTIGPMVASKLGVQTVDLGNPMWSMHSIRETCDAADHGEMIRLLKAFYSQ